MTDWEDITNNIKRAMQAVNDAQEASETLMNETNMENLKTFQEQMAKLQEELCSTQWALDHAGQYSMDEVIDALNKMFSGRPAPYRSSQPVDISTKPKKH